MIPYINKGTSDTPFNLGDNANIIYNLLLTKVKLSFISHLTIITKGLKDK